MNFIFIFRSRSCGCCDGDVCPVAGKLENVSGLKLFRVALIGSPNSGKSTIFNYLTGGRQFVGNWPGVTVEKKEGFFIFGGFGVSLIDLPGCYTLSPTSVDEKIARDFLLEAKLDAVLQVVDASKLDRDLLLTVELLEMGIKLVVALNMFDLVEKLGYSIDLAAMSKILGVDVVPTVAVKGIGLHKLASKLVDVAKSGRSRSLRIDYGDFLEKYISDLEKRLSKYDIEANPRWVALKLLEGDEGIAERVKVLGGFEVVKLAEKYINEINEKVGSPPLHLIYEARYRFVRALIKRILRKIEDVELTVSELLDHVFTHKVWGVPIFIIIMWTMLKFTFDVAAPFVDAIDLTFSYLSSFIKDFIPIPWLASLIGDGLIGGVGFVLTFLPNILFLFLFISFLEDVGYMARAAYNLDAIMRKFGLSGKSVVPLILGMGCNVPAIMSTRTIESRSDRLTTIMVTPLIPCSARLPVFIMLASIFFGRNAPLAILSMYFIGFTLALLIAKLIKKLFKSGEETPLIIELPTYKIPTTRIVWNQASMRTRHFIEKVYSTILIASIFMWTLISLPPGSSVEKSLAAQLGKMLEPILKPLGFTWEIAFALIFGLMAKEVIIAAFGLVYGASVSTQLLTVLTPIQAFALMVFILVYIPCIPTIVTVKSETKSLKYTLAVIAYELILAYALALAIVSIGSIIL